MTETKRVPELRFKAEDGSEFPEWEDKKLGEIAKIKRGASPRPISDSRWFSEFGSRGWVRISDVSAGGKFLTRVTQYLSSEGVERSVKVDPSELIMSIAGSVGKPAIVQTPVCIHDGFIALKELKANVDFTYYLLERASQKWGKLTQSSSQSNLNSEIVSSLPIPLPSLPEQKKIAEFFSLLDERISKQADKVASLREYKKGLSQRIFSRELRFKDENGEDYPEWEEKKLGEVAKMVSGFPFKGGDYISEGKFKVITNGNVQRSRYLNTNQMSQILEAPAQIKPYQIPAKDDILITLDGNVGRVSLVPVGRFLLAQRVGLLLVDTSVTSSTYLYDVLSRDVFIREMESKQQGGGLKHIYARDVEGFSIPLPSLPEQEKIAALLSTMDSKIAKEEEKLEALREQKRGLMQRMFV